jgi:hypothetical protein
MARSAVPKLARPHQGAVRGAVKTAPRASLKQELIRQLACGDTRGARHTRLLMAESNARKTEIVPSLCHAVIIEDGRVVETVRMTATPGARSLFERQEEPRRKLG